MGDLMIAQAAASLILAAALLVYVGLFPCKSIAHWTLLGVLAAISAWDAGAALGWARPGLPGALRLGADLMFFGAMFVPPLFLGLAAECSHTALLEERPIASIAGLLTPSAFLYLAFLTNDWHGLFLHGGAFDVFATPPSRWAGPLFWVHTGWAYFACGLGIALCLAASRRSRDALERRRLRLLAAGALVPVVVNAAHVLDLSPIPVPLTYAALGITGLLVVTAIARYRFLEIGLPARQVIAHLHEGLVLADAAGRVIDANPAAEKLLGRRLEELRTRDVASLMADWDPSGALSREIASPSRPGVIARSIDVPDGRSMDLSGGWVRAEGATLGRFLILADRTEQRRYERFRQRAQRLEGLGSLVAGVSHEINNPLAFVRANLTHVTDLAGQLEDWLRSSGSKRADDARQLLEVAEESLDGVLRIGEIVATLRRLARDPRPDREPVDANQLALDAIRLASLSASDAVAVETRLSDGLPPIAGSAGQLGQVLLNLLLNAKQALANQPDPHVLVETALCRDCGRFSDGVVIRVHDSGPGVPAELRERIFDPFFTTKGPDDGMGMGLAISHELARAHDGTLEVGPSPLGGACFTVRLPPRSQGADA